MGGFSIWHWLILILLVMVLFGRGKISDLMGDVGKGMKSFKDGLNDEEDEKRRKFEEERRRFEEERRLYDADRGTEPRRLPPEEPIDVTPRAAERDVPPRDDQGR